MASSPASSVTATNSRDKAGDSKVVDEKRHGGIEDVLPNAKDLKAKDTQVVKKKRWWLKAPREPFASFDDAPIIPLATASWFSRITFLWIQPMLTTGYQRTLVPTDMWRLHEEFEAGYLADKLMANFDRRRKDVENWNKALDDGSYKPSALRKAWWRIRKHDGKRKVGMALAISDTFFWTFWSAGILKVISDGLLVTSPLVTRALITFGSNAYYAHRGVPGYEAQPIGVGVGLAFGLWGMQIAASLCLHTFFQHSAGTGVLARAALITSLYRKALVLSGKARTVITNGRLVNHIGTDVSRIDFCAGFFHMTHVSRLSLCPHSRPWTAPIQLIVIMIILLVQIGPSCLVGIAFLFLMIPPQSWAMKKMFGFRRKAMVWTDKRARLIGELLGGMRVLKFFAWEIPYLEKLQDFRAKELVQIRSLLILRAGTTGVAMSLPTLATVLAFVTYANTGHTTSAQSIFTSLTLFQLIRMPLMMLPMALSTCTDASNALGRLTEVFLAEERSAAYDVDPSAKYAVRVDDADFQWESSPPDAAPKSKKEQAKLAAQGKTAAKIAKKERKEKEKAAKVELKLNEKGAADPEEAAHSGDATADIPDDGKLDPTTTPEEAEILQLRNVNLRIPRGQLCAVVGAVGSGKSSLLQALVGEMKRTRGEVIFGGQIAYAAQQAWMQSCSLKENILFGRPYDEARYRQVIHDACLEADFDMLPYGDETEIGEKGVTLSGGQKQRVNIARALYYNADIVLLDDPLSAVDAHVGKHLFDNAILGALAGKTRILVTHALHFLPRVDYIICLEHGKVTQEGTYADLIGDKEGAFSKLMEEFGGDLEEKKEEDETKEEDAVENEPEVDKKADKPKAKALMQEEERATGSVSGAVYRHIFTLAKGWYTFPVLLGSMVLQQAAQVLSGYILVWWQEDTFDQTMGFYEGLYAMFGVLQAIFSFAIGVATTLIGYNISRELHSAAITGVMRAPMSFFDTTPLGRIMNRFSKDIDTIDNTLNDSFRMFVSTLAGVLGSVVLIAIVQPWFLLVVAGVLCLYAFAARFYRQSARELKRLDNLLRSSLYASFSESLSGLTTIRAYGETDRFLAQTAAYLDLEDRAYYLTVVNQRWLGLRLDFFGSCLTFAVAMFGVGTRTSVSPSQTGLVLSYILTISSAFSWMVRQGAEVENDLNSVERVLHYANELDKEAPAVIEDARPPAEWPSGGAIEFKNVEMRYRPDLPPVLKGLSMSVGRGEKIGVVGRTGAGKSSIMQTLFRIVEVSAGSIEVDGIDISTIGLSDLRKKIAIIPQDALLFNGTVRTNLDPFGEHGDAELYDALKRAWLVDRDQPMPVAGAPAAATPTSSRFTLDLVIEDEGQNLSVGERSLVSLARALVKDSKIIVLDEATASVDFATDSRIQATIRSEFKEKTLLVIAHRLRTIVDSDRVLVMDAGAVAEFDTPLNLFRARGIFAGMCERSGITEADIVGTTFSSAPAGVEQEQE
ncbi:P-loop containing nucleoside triphosphate hydrolase protein [Rhodotorula diobovata]|uniref:P-loop containing nucleoside triphosphate hydrolase protein n=1 Tax=Rhodotorula diobovata TaxID=5288 RepID=A0A5C5FZN0_9BASI|nr:P-loop containing nucleoside triphosphate hydrolase protein [Rhodotorula diobovata]